MSIAFGAASGSVAGTTSVNVSYPANMSTSVGQLLLLHVAAKLTTSVPIPPIGWVLVGESRSNTGTAGAGVGPTRVYVFARVKLIDGTESGTITVAIGGGNVVVAYTSRWSSSTGEFYVDTARAEDASNDTSLSLSLTPELALPTEWVRAGDALMVFYAWPSQTITTSSPSLSVPGLTLSSQSTVSDANSTTGNDIRTRCHRWNVSSGTQSDKTGSFTATFSAAMYGSGILVRISDSPLPSRSDRIPFVAARSGRWTSSARTEVLPPIGTRPGDLIISTCMIGLTSGTDASIAASKGWTVLDDVPVNTRRAFTIARIYNPSDSEDTYVLDRGTNSGAAVSTVAVRNHGVETGSDILVGTGYSRPSSIQTINAPGITTTENDMLVLAGFGEATNAVETDLAQNTGDFLWSQITRDVGIVNVAIEYSLLMEKDMASAGASGDVVIQFVGSSALNGRGIQFAIPPIPLLEIPNYRGASPSRSIFKGVSDILDLYVGTRL